MTTRAIIGIHADRQSAVAALQEAIALPEAIKEESLSGEDQLFSRLEYWLSRAAKETIECHVVGVGFIDGWTLIEEPQMKLPIDLDLLKQISFKLSTTVAGYLLQTTSGSYGYIECRSGQVIRNFLFEDGKVVSDDGRLEDEPPPIINDPMNGVEKAWQRLIPSTDIAEFEIRLFSTQQVAAEPPSSHGRSALPNLAKKPWWKVW